jgi:hypothetical protein
VERLRETSKINSYQQQQVGKEFEEIKKERAGEVLIMKTKNGTS